jgi:succinylglutamate desuccinylase
MQRKLNKKNYVLSIILMLFVLVNCTFVNPTQVDAAVASKTTVKVETIAAGTKYATKLYVIKSNKPGPVVMVVGGVHGNEKAGYTAAKKLTDYKITRGTLLVLPEANKRAVAANKRYLRDGDLNRDFPTTKNGKADTVLARGILSAMKKYKVDWVMDMHEGYNYSRLSSSSSVGQSVIYYPSSQTTALAKNIVSSLNKKISTSYKKFDLRKYPVKGSLTRSAAVACGSNSMIVETCTKDKLSTRVNYQLQAFNKLMDKLNMR